MGLIIVVLITIPIIIKCIIIQQESLEIGKWGEREACLRSKNLKGEFDHCRPYHHPHDHQTHHNITEELGDWEVGGEGGLSEEKEFKGGS